MKRIKFTIFILFFTLIFTGCTSNTTTETKKDYTQVLEDTTMSLIEFQLRSGINSINFENDNFGEEYLNQQEYILEDSNLQSHLDILKNLSLDENKIKSRDEIVSIINNIIELYNNFDGTNYFEIMDSVFIELDNFEVELEKEVISFDDLTAKFLEDNKNPDS